MLVRVLYCFGYENGQFTSRSHTTVDEDDEEEDSHVLCDKQILAVVEGKGLGIATDCGGVKRLDAENRHLYYQWTILRTTTTYREIENYRKYTL